MAALIKNPVVSVETARKLVSGRKWFHRVEVVPSVISPGISPFSGDIYDPNAMLNWWNLGDLVGLKVLEVGSWDGPVAYELAQSGIDVTATDIQDPARTGFGVLAQVSGIEIPYVRASVYELSRKFAAEQFDLVLFHGVFYHLKHPVLAFEEIAKVTKMGGRLSVSGSGIGDKLDDLSLKPVKHARAAQILRELDELGVPLSLNYTGPSAGGTTWVLPNRTTLAGWLQNAGYTPSNINIQHLGRGYSALSTNATKTRDAFMAECMLVGETGTFYRVGEVA